MIGRRIAIVAGSAACSSNEPQRMYVTLPRLPWDPEITQPDPREETRPRSAPIRNPALDENTGPFAPARGWMPR